MGVLRLATECREEPTMPNSRRGTQGPGFPDDGDFTARRVLFVDLPPELVATLPPVTEHPPTSTRFGGLTIDLVARQDPDLVLAPLVGPGFDILDVAAQLLRCGYTGSLRALTPPLPNLAAVRNEVKSHCADLDVDIVVVSPPAEAGH